MTLKVQILKNKFNQSLGLPFKELLPESVIRFAISERLYRSLLKIIVHKVVPDRPGRSEPRVTKRRPKAYPRLNKPRHELAHQLQTA